MSPFLQKNSGRMQTSKIVLQPHQQKIKDLAVSGNLPDTCWLFWSMGSGKTYACCGIMEGVQAAKGGTLKAIVLCDKTLEGQWSKATKTYFEGKQKPNITVERFQMLNKDADPRSYDICIVDEAHRFRNAFRSDEGAPAEYKKWIQKIMRCGRVVYLSGTPLVSDSEKDMEGFKMMMRESPSNPLYGRVFRYDPQSDKRKAKMYASMNYNPPVKCPMSWSQTLLYFMSQRSAFSLSFGGQKTTIQTSRRNAYNSALRSISNNPFNDDPMLSPKFRSIIKDMKAAHDSGKRQLVYSSRRELGAKALHDLWKSQSFVKASDVFLIDGSLDSDVRTKIVDRFNRKGTKSLFITDAGGTGVDLKSVDIVRLLEPHESIMLENQVINRAIRYRSHKSQQGVRPTVEVYLYTSVFPSADQPVDPRFTTLVNESGLVDSNASSATLSAIRDAVMKQCIGADAKHETVDQKVMKRRVEEFEKIQQGNAKIASMDPSLAPKTTCAAPVSDTSANAKTRKRTSTSKAASDRKTARTAFPIVAIA